jgi:hypothetical protein
MTMHISCLGFISVHITRLFIMVFTETGIISELIGLKKLQSDFSNNKPVLVWQPFHFIVIKYNILLCSILMNGIAIVSDVI